MKSNTQASRASWFSAAGATIDKSDMKFDTFQENRKAMSLLIIFSVTLYCHDSSHVKFHMKCIVRKTSIQAKNQKMTKFGVKFREIHN